MLSRIADSLFWMSRYIERADGVMRMLKINYTASLDKSSVEEFSWKPVLKLFSSLNDEEIRHMAYDSRKVLHYLVDNKDNPNSLVNIITRSRENARGVQDHITLEVWACLNNFYHHIRQEKIGRMIDNDQAMEMLDESLQHGLLYYGTSDITMPRGEGWCFMNMGKSLERALQTIDLLDVKFSDLSYDMNAPAETPYWKYILMSASGYELYVKTYRSGLQGQNVVDQMVFNVDFPRSVLYSLIQLERNFKKLRSDRNIDSFDKVNFLIGRIKSKVQYSDLQSISQVGLHTYLKDLRQELFAIGNALNSYYFNHY